MNLTTAYHHSALPALGIALETALADPVLRATLELGKWMRDRAMRREAKRAERIAAGKWIEKGAQQ